MVPAAGMEDVVSLAKRRGFVFPSSEIYGGLASCWDYGPLGAELKRNVQGLWWRSMTRRGDVEGLDSSILMHPDVWRASGHAEGFNDSMADCRRCKGRFRADALPPGGACPGCGAEGSLTEPRDFNLMLATRLGPVDDPASAVFLRPETAQGIFVNFLNVQETMRRRLPFGIAQVGKAFRNEISPGNFTFRTREFEQMEMQYFTAPGDDREAMEEWRERRWRWHLDNGVAEGNLRLREHGPDELAHYAAAAVDIEYRFPHGWGEMEGVHRRTDFDLGRHQERSGKRLAYVDQLDGNRRFLPHVVETSVGLDRCVLALLCDALRTEGAGGGEGRTVLGLSPRVAPVKAAVLPLSRKDALTGLARRAFEDVRSRWRAEFDEAGSIGRRYRRQDEIGTPLCVTIDFDSLDDGAATVRDRDTMAQERVPLEGLVARLEERLGPGAAP